METIESLSERLLKSIAENEKLTARLEKAKQVFREQEAKIKDLQDKLSYCGEMLEAQTGLCDALSDDVAYWKGIASEYEKRDDENVKSIVITAEQQEVDLSEPTFVGTVLQKQNSRELPGLHNAIISM